MAVIQRHSDEPDWCHICGARSSESADVWFPLASVPGGAEHATRELHRAGFGSPPALVNYVRVCAQCARTMAEVAEGQGPGRVVREPGRRRW